MLMDILPVIHVAHRKDEFSLIVLDNCGLLNILFYDQSYGSFP